MAHIHHAHHSLRRSKRAAEEREEVASKRSRIDADADAVSTYETNLAALLAEMERWRAAPGAELLTVVSHKVDRLQDEVDRFEGCVAWRKSFNRRLGVLAATVDEALLYDQRRKKPPGTLRLILEMIRLGRRERNDAILYSAETRLEELVREQTP